MDRPIDALLKRAMSIGADRMAPAPAAPVAPVASGIGNAASAAPTPMAGAGVGTGAEQRREPCYRR